MIGLDIIIQSVSLLCLFRNILYFAVPVKCNRRIYEPCGAVVSAVDHCSNAKEFPSLRKWVSLAVAEFYFIYCVDI